MENGAATELAQRCGLAAGVSLDPLGRPALDDAEGEAMQSTFADVSLVMGDTDQGAGTLFITNRQVVWTAGSGLSSGFHAYSAPFTAIMMHAVASPSEAFDRPSIYMQLDGAAPADDEDDGSPPPEVRLVPGDASQMDALFQALCEGAAANPDPDAESDEGDFFFDEDEVATGAEADPEQAALAQRLNSMLQVPDQFQQGSAAAATREEGQFSDADDDDECAATPACPCCRPRR